MAKKEYCLFLWIISFALLLVTFSFSDGFAKENRTALVIGNARYPGEPLQNTLNDARDMKNKLRTLGFKVIHGENLTKKQLNDYIYAFFDTLIDRGGVGLFYYAGHAIQIDGRNYLLPVDYQKYEELINSASIVVDKITQGMKNSGANFNILILDACRNNPYQLAYNSPDGTRSARAIALKSKKGLAGVDAPPSTFIAYATAPDRVALDGAGRNGVYTKHLLKYIDEEGYSIEEVFKKTSKAVLRETHNQQVPWVNSSITREFYFNGEPKVQGGKRRIFGAF